MESTKSMRIRGLEVADRAAQEEHQQILSGSPPGGDFAQAVEIAHLERNDVAQAD